MPVPALDTKRALALRSMPDTCDVMRVTRVDDGQGGWSETVATIATVACSISNPAGLAMAGNERPQIGQIAGAVTAIVTVPANTGIRGADRVRVTNAETEEAITYEVVYATRRSVEVVQRVLCKDITAQ